MYDGGMIVIIFLWLFLVEGFIIIVVWFFFCDGIVLILDLKISFVELIL